MEDIFNISVVVFISIFTMAIILILGSYIIGDQLHPLMKNMTIPNNSAFSVEEYDSYLDKIKETSFLILLMLLAVPFIYFIVRVLFKKEPTSVYDYGG